LPRIGRLLHLGHLLRQGRLLRLQVLSGNGDDGIDRLLGGDYRRAAGSRRCGCRWRLGGLSWGRWLLRGRRRAPSTAGQERRYGDEREPPQSPQMMACRATFTRLASPFWVEMYAAILQTPMQEERERLLALRARISDLLVRL
jgi:hypothetical protein